MSRFTSADNDDMVFFYTILIRSTGKFGDNMKYKKRFDELGKGYTVLSLNCWLFCMFLVHYLFFPYLLTLIFLQLNNPLNEKDLSFTINMLSRR